MTRFIFVLGKNNKLNAYRVDGETKENCNSYLDFLLDSTLDVKISNVKKSGNDLVVRVDGYELVFKNYSNYKEMAKYSKYFLYYESVLAKREAAKNVTRVKEIPKEKRKFKKESSVSYRRFKSFLLVSFLIGAGALGYTNYKNFVKDDDFDSLPLEDGILDDNVANVIVPEYQVAYEAPVPVPSSDQFNYAIYNYASEKGFNDYDLIDQFINSNTNHDASGIAHVKKLIDYAIFMKNNGYNNLYLMKCRNNSVIYGMNDERFMLVPTNIELVNSVTQLNPENYKSGIENYNIFLEGIRLSVINMPNSIIIGSANSDFDTNDYNGNMLENVINFSLNSGIGMQSIGVLGYGESGLSALINAGKVLENHPSLKVRIANLDAYGIDIFNNEVNNLLNGIDSMYGNEIRALLEADVELVNIIPSTSGNRIPDYRPSEALNQSMNLASNFNNTMTILSSCTNHDLYPEEAYQMNILGYLTGSLTKGYLINGTNYSLPNTSFNQETGLWQQNDSNDTIYFG